MGRGKTCEEDDGLGRNTVAVKQSGSSFSGLSQMMLRLTVVGVYKDPRAHVSSIWITSTVEKSNPAAEPHSSPQGCSVWPRTDSARWGPGGVFTLLLLPLL